MINHVTPPKVQYLLQYTDSNSVPQTVDVTPDFAEWKTFETSIVRDDLTGAYIQIQDGGISFTGDSYDLVRSIYETQGFRAVAKLIVNLRKDTFPDLWTYEQKVSLDLNFAKYNRTNTSITLTANENGLKAMVKANASQKYDIVVADLHPEILDYDGLEIKETLSWFPGKIIGNPDLGYIGGSAGENIPILFSPSVYGSDQDVNPNYKNYLTRKNQPLQRKSTIDVSQWNGSNWSVCNWLPIISVEKGYQKFNFVIKAKLSIQFGSVMNTLAFQLTPIKNNISGVPIVLCSISNAYSDTFNVQIDSTTEIPDSIDADSFMLEVTGFRMLDVTNTYYNEPVILNQFEFESGGVIQIDWVASVRNHINIPVVSELNLLQQLINRLTNTTGVYTASIDAHTELIRITGGESIRNFLIQYIHTSLNDFINYMKSCWGYEYEVSNNKDVVISTYTLVGTWSSITSYLKNQAVNFQGRYFAAPSDIVGGDYPGNTDTPWILISEYGLNGNILTHYAGGAGTIHFAPRDSFFQNVPALTIPEINNIKLSVNEAYIYTGVKIGIPLVQYLSINGTDEFRFLEEWSTGVQNVINVLDLTCPYRTDSYGFQLLSEKQHVVNATDDQSDNAIFVLHVALSGVNYIPDRTAALIGVSSPLSMFNALFSPRQCLIRNKSLLGISTDTLKFTSTLGLADITINGISEKADIPVASSLFSPDVLEMDVGDIVDLPEHQNGLVSCQYRGEQFHGFIKKLSHNWGSNQKTSCTLFLKKI